MRHLLSLLGLCMLAREALGSLEKAGLTLFNHAGSPIDLFWVDPSSPRNPVRQLDRPLRNSTDTKINSFNTHQFVVRYANHRPGVEAHFTKGLGDETFHVTYNATTNNLQIQLANKFAIWQEKLVLSRRWCHGLHDEDLATCVSKTLSEEIDVLSDSFTSLQKTTTKIAHRLRNYTCDDDTRPTTPPISTYPYTWKNQQYEVQVLLNMTHAKIWLVEDFVTEDECALLEKVGRPKLYRATVAAEDGTSVVSENRKAQQAAYDSHQTQKEKDPLWDLQQRLLSITNQHAGYNLQAPGQEGFTIIQYNPSDQYTPHCDGSCDHSEYTPHGRLATAVMYCKVPEKGGATTFTRTNMVVRPKVGAVTFFSYKGPDGRMDAGYTEHSGCPVLAGEKLITTFWMREGVSEKEPWGLFDPQGLPILDPNADA